MGKWMVTVDRPKNDDMEALIQNVVKAGFTVTETVTPTTILVEGNLKASVLGRVIKSNLEKNTRSNIYGNATIAEVGAAWEIDLETDEKFQKV